MAEILKLSAKRRTVIGKGLGQLRRDGQLPAVLYGHGVEATPIQLPAREASRVLRAVRGSELIELTVDGQAHQVLLQDRQRDSLRGHYLHLDFLAVDMTRKLRANIPLRLVGASFAVQSLAGVLVRGVTEIEVECLPADLVNVLDVDISSMRDIGSALHVRDVVVPPALTVMTGPDELVARVTAQAKEEDLAVPTAATPTEVEVIEKGKPEEEGEEE
jgi:large subunit ribosomal protein L25